MPWSFILPLLFLCGLKSTVDDDYTSIMKKYSLLARLGEGCMVAIVLYTTVRVIEAIYPVQEVKAGRQVHTEKITICEHTPMKQLEKETGSQTHHRNYLKDLEITRRRHEKGIRAVHREVRHMRRKFTEKISKDRCRVNEANAILSALQLKIPKLQKDRNSFEDEKAAIEMQLEEERQRHCDLMSKFMRFHGQLIHESGLDNFGLKYH